MKRFIVVFIISALMLSLVSCKPAGQQTGANGDSPPTDASSAPPVTKDEPAADVIEDAPPAPVPTQIPPGAFEFTLENMPAIDGSTATIPLIEAVYSVLLGIPRAEAALMVNTTGTDNAYDNLIWGKVDILLVYSPSPDTIKNAKNNDIGLMMASIGRDGLVFLVNKANPVGSLTPEQIVSIYSGGIHNWKDVGGEDAGIRAFQRPYRSGSQTMMDELVMKGVPMAETEAEYVIGEMGGLIEAVAQFDNAQSAIGYNVYYFVSQMEMNENVRMLAVDGVAPSTQSISDGSYPFVSNFYAVIRADTPEDSPARILYDWIQSADGQNLVRHEGYATAD